MSDTNERSGESGGSVDEPARDAAGDRLPAGADKLLRIAALEAEVARLRLTDEEQEILPWVSRYCRENQYHDWADAIADLLKRHKENE